MKLYPLLIALIGFSSACENRKKDSAETDAAETEKQPVTLQLKWQTDPALTTCESVLYNEDQDILYVSNINGGADQKDGNGFISKVSVDGEIQEEKWVTSLDAPKGMGLHDGKLYVADIDQVHEIDTESGALNRSYPVDGAIFLNDVTVNDGKVYISDSRGGNIYVIEDGELSTFMEDLQGPNGLLGRNGVLAVALWDAKTFNTVDISSKEITLRTEGIENPDGIVAVGNNEYLVSSWNGMIHHIGNDGEKTLVLDTRQDSLNAADIEYVSSKNLLLVPTFFKNTVMAYELEK